MSDGRSKRVVFAIAVQLLFLPALAFAQTGIIAGVVKDTSGAVMPGVNVEAASPALIEKVRAAVTDIAGQYKVVDLPPGTYSVTFTLVGFNAVKREGVELSAGFTANVNADLRVGTLEEAITVSGQSPVIDVQNTRQQTTMSRDVIDSIPAAKSPQSFAVLVPGVIASTATGRMPIQGQLNAYNLLNVGPVLAANNTFGATYLNPTATLQGRMFKFGAQLDW